MKTLLVLILALPLATQAATIFSDGFEGDAQGGNVVPAGWTITNLGTVDIINFGCHSGSNCVDLDGSSGLAAVLAHTFAATIGVNYTLNFWLAGSQRGDVNEVDVVLGSNTLALPGITGNMASTLFSLSWTATSTGTATFSFHNLGGDNVGAILDDVSITTPDVGGVPEPGTSLLLGGGLASLAVLAALRRRNNLVQTP